MGHNNLDLDTSDWTMLEDGRKDGWMEFWSTGREDQNGRLLLGMRGAGVNIQVSFSFRWQVVVLVIILKDYGLETGNKGTRMDFTFDCVGNRIHFA